MTTSTSMERASSRSRNHRRVTVLLVALTVVLGSAIFEQHVPGAPILVEGRSILSSIPGVELMSDLASNLANRVGRALNNEILTPISNNLNECLEGNICTQQDPDASRNVAEIIRSRGFQAEEHEVTTRDGYILTIQRIVNPLIDANQRKNLKPVILQHGLLSSSVDWVINSVNVKPQKYPRNDDPISSLPPLSDQDNTIESHRRQSIVRQLESELENLNKTLTNELGGTDTATNLPDGSTGADSQEHPNALGFYLANEGYDVFLANSRGNIYGQKHAKMSSWNPKFWAFTFDEQIKYDLPDTTSYIQNLTGHTKVGYVGHSQGTAMMFGLLSDLPNYADVFEPIIMLAPVAYVSNSISPVKYFAVYTPIFEHINMWFGSSNVAVRYLAPLVCKPELIKNEVCANLVFLSTGFDADQFDMSRASAYMAHMPSGTSVKNIAHYGQETLSGRFAHFDHGILGNQAEYGQSDAPDYDLTKIRSESLVLFTAENDWLASPKDVAKLKADLTVAPYKVYNITEFKPKWNHIDFVYGKDCGELVNTRIIEAFHHFD